MNLGAPPPNRNLAALRRQWRAEREAVQEAARRRDRLAAMSPRARQLAALEELHLLEEKAVSMAAATDDPVKKAGFEATVAEIRHKIKKEHAMPAIDLEAPGKIRATFTAKAATIQSELAALAADDGRDPSWKNRRRAELTADLDVARQTAHDSIQKWATAANREAAKGMNADTRSPEDCMKDLAVDLRSSRYAASVTTQAEAQNKLMSEPQRLRSVDFRQSLSYAQAAAQHGAMGASRLAAEIEAEYRSSWPGRAQAQQLLQTISQELSTWHIESAAAVVQSNRAAIAAAKATGDHAGVGHLAEAAMRDSISAKTHAYAESQRTGQPYRSPIGPDTTPTREPSTQIRSDPSTTDL
jgi:hypothetical protein